MSSDNKDTSQTRDQTNSVEQAHKQIKEAQRQADQVRQSQSGSDSSNTQQLQNTNQTTNTNVKVLKADQTMDSTATSQTKDEHPASQPPSGPTLHYAEDINKPFKQ